MTVSAESVLLNKHQGKITCTVSWFMSTSIWYNINTDQCNVTTSKIYSVAVEDNKTANSKKITIVEYKYGVKGNRGLSNSDIIAPIHYMWLNYLLFASNQSRVTKTTWTWFVNLILLIVYHCYFPWQIIIICTCILMTRTECILLPTVLRYDLYFLIIKKHLRWQFAK